MNFEVLKPGLFTGIQDFGRDGFARFGVPQSGAMDRYSAKIANLLVGNSAYEAVLEMTMAGATLKFNKPARIAIAGLGAKISLDKTNIDINTAFEVGQGQILKIGQITKGFRVYLAVFGGIQSEEKLGSRSMFHPITEKVKVEKGDQIEFTNKSSDLQRQNAGIKFDYGSMISEHLEVFKGPEYEHFPQKIKGELIKKRFRISKNNSRQAYQLEEKMPNDLDSMLTQPVLPGTVQLTPSGNLIVLMRDCQTTGGYPRVLQLSEKAINQLAQKKQGDDISFNFN
jgi:biotin-dependent carboxylase-like uncharacterized protein